MTRDDIIRMAREAGLHLYVNDLTEEPYALIVERFANLVAAAEREACAKLAVEEFEAWHICSQSHDTANMIAAAIRAMGQE